MIMAIKVLSFVPLILDSMMVKCILNFKFKETISHFLANQFKAKRQCNTIALNAYFAILNLIIDGFFFLVKFLIFN